MKQHFHRRSETTVGKIYSHFTMGSKDATKMQINTVIQRNFWCPVPYVSE